MTTVKPANFVTRTAHKAQDTLIRGGRVLYSEKFLERIKKDPGFFRALVFGFYFMNISVNAITKATGSWYNPALPKPERKFAAAADLADGVIKMAIVFPVYVFIYNSMNTLQKNLFKSIENAPNRLAHAKKGFQTLLSIGLATVLLNNILTPFLAIPLGMYIKKRYFDKVPTQKKQSTEAVNKL